jgi:nucleotide-binding universal stress UspA family protein
MADATGENARKIVVGVDGSPSSIDALRWAVRHAQLIGSSVEALLAWEYPSSSGVVPPVSEDLDFDADSRRPWTPRSKKPSEPRVLSR